MFNYSVAEGYQWNSSKQREDGKQMIQNETSPRDGDSILDLGCGTGELSAYLAELVGQHGRVVGVDPDIDRIKNGPGISQSSKKNLSFFEGRHF